MYKTKWMFLFDCGVYYAVYNEVVHLSVLYWLRILSCKSCRAYSTVTATVTLVCDLCQFYSSTFELNNSSKTKTVMTLASSLYCMLCIARNYCCTVTFSHSVIYFFCIHRCVTTCAILSVVLTF